MEEVVNNAEQVCITVGATGLIIASFVSNAASVISNILPAPDKAQSGFVKILSRIVHFVATDIVTAAK